MPALGTNRQSLAGQHFQVAVIGGGAVGAAIARECARAGKHTLLVEQHDFGSGATSRSSRIVSGLPAFERGDMGLARDIARESAELVRERPHLLRASHFLMAAGGHGARSPLSARTKLWLYRKITGSSLDSRSFEIERKKLERTLDSSESWALFDFEDVVCDYPERLVAEWVMEAAAAGATVRNHTQVLAVDVVHGRARGLLLRDWISNQEQRVEATWIINAAGAWASRLCQRSSVKLRKPLATNLRSSSIVVTHFPGAPGNPVCAEAIDGRPLTLLPWNEQLMVGATEAVENGDPAKAVPTPAEVDHLYQSLLKLFPKARMAQPELRFAFTGIRSLPFSSKPEAGHASCPHSLHDHAEDGAARLISVAGGSLATARIIARECAEAVGIRANSKGSSAGAAAFQPLSDEWISELAHSGRISEDSARCIAEWHGSQSEEIVRLAGGGIEFRSPVCPHSQHIVAEVAHAYLREHAMTLADALLRRVPVALGLCWSEACSREAAWRIGAVLGWNDQSAGAALEALETERASLLHRPQSNRRLGAAAD